MNARTPLSLFLAIASYFSLTASLAQAEAQPKYGPAITPLSKSHEFFAKNLAPDFWAMMPYYVPQQTGSACSIASISMVMNAVRSHQTLDADTELATQTNILKKVGDEEWTKAVGNQGRGRNLEQIASFMERALKAYGFEKASVEAVYVNDKSPATRKKLHDILVANEKSSKDFVLINYIQGTMTGDANIGHVAPLAAYDSKTKRVLVLDPDRDWYEPYWASEETLLDSMNTFDTGAAKNRGYLWVKMEKPAH